MLALSGFGAYDFPFSSVPANADLATILTTLWQRLVITISLAIVGILGILGGILLYGFGRVVEEMAYLQPLDEPDKKK